MVSIEARMVWHNLDLRTIGWPPYSLSHLLSYLALL